MGKEGGAKTKDEREMRESPPPKNKSQRRLRRPPDYFVRALFRVTKNDRTKMRENPLLSRDIGSVSVIV